MTGPDTSETADARTERFRQRDIADQQVGVSVDLSDLSPDFVHASPIDGYPGKAAVYLAGLRVNVVIRGDIGELRAVAVEIDRQLARLEVEARVDGALDTEDDSR